jgi:hypothetical protein
MRSSGIGVLMNTGADDRDLCTVVQNILMTKSWLVSFARAVRPTERSARRLARQQPVYVYGGDLGRHGAEF